MPHWEWEKSAIQSQWSHLVGFAERKNQQAALAFVRVEATEKSTEFLASDGDVTWQSRWDKAGNEPGVLLIPARKFWDIARSVPDHTVLRLAWDAPHEPDRGPKIRLQANRSRFAFSAYPASLYPIWPAFPDNAPTCTVQAALLKMALEHVVFAATENDSRLYLNGVLWELGDRVLTCVATDGHRLAESQCAASGLSFEGGGDTAPQSARALIPKRAVTDLCRLLSHTHGAEVTIGWAENRVQIQLHEGVFSARSIDSPYPDHRSFFVPRSDPVVACETATLRSALQRLAIVAGAQAIAVFRLGEQHLEIATDDPQAHEEGREELQVAYSGPETVVRLNIRYCLEFLQTVDAPEITWTCAQVTAPVIWHGTSACASRYAVMPFRR